MFPWLIRPDARLAIRCPYFAGPGRGRLRHHAPSGSPRLTIMPGHGPAQRRGLQGRQSLSDRQYLVLSA